MQIWHQFKAIKKWLRVIWNIVKNWSKMSWQSSAAFYDKAGKDLLLDTAIETQVLKKMKQLKRRVAPTYMEENNFKVAISPSKKVGFISFNE